jgi:hypothetical protein
MKNSFELIKEAISNPVLDEQVTKEEALRAIAVLNQIRVFTKGDYLLYLASVNLLNRFVKFNRKLLNYRFKNYLYPLLYQIMEDKPSFINMFAHIDYQMHHLSLLMIDIEGIHFSFHSLDLNIIKEMAAETHYTFTSFDWDHIRKQKCASTLFKKALYENNELTGLSIGNSDLMTSIKFSEEKYQQYDDLNKPIPFIHLKQSLKEYKGDST